MDIFLLLLGNLLPLYVLIGLGYIAGRFFHVERQTLGALGIYIFMPIIAFGFVAQMEIKPSYVALPLIFYALLTVGSLIGLNLGKLVYGDKRANLLALCANAGNIGYFGLPLVMSLFSQEWVGVYIFLTVGGLIYEATIMYYIAARGRFNVRDSLIKLAKFPALYALSAGVLYNLSGAPLSPVFETYWGYFKGAYVVVGMMLIGAALSRVQKFVFAPRFVSLSFAAKFVMWPAMVSGLILLDTHALHIYSAEIHKLFFVLAIVPIAANISAFAVEMDLKPEKAASTILLSTFFALFSIPFSLYLYEQFIAIAP